MKEKDYQILKKEMFRQQLLNLYLFIGLALIIYIQTSVGYRLIFWIVASPICCLFIYLLLHYQNKILKLEIKQLIEETK